MDRKVGVEIKKEGDTGVVTFKAAILTDVHEIADAAERIEQFIQANHPERVIFDFDAVKFFSSQVLGLLLEIRAKLQACNGQVVISGINPQLHRIFKITNLDKIFRFFPDKKNAINRYP